MSTGKKLRSLIEVLVTSEEQCQKRCGGDKLTTLQQLITETMIAWASTEIHDPKLISEIFSLLYRQYDEVHEVVMALRKTYIIEVTEDSMGKRNYDVEAFRQALASLRLLLKVGMGKKEEKLLSKSLRWASIGRRLISRH